MRSPDIRIPATSKPSYRPRDPAGNRVHAPCTGVGRTARLLRRFSKGWVLAENPQQTIRELRELVVEYAKQETVEPLKGLGRYVAWGIAGALLLGLGFVFLAIGALRALQDETYPHFTGNWSWVPYAIVVFGSFLIAGLVWMARGKRKTSGRGER